MATKPKKSFASRTKFLVHLGLMFLISVAVVLLFFQVYLPWTTNHGEEIEVPNLDGLTSLEAERKLEEFDLRLQVSDTVYSPAHAPLAVISQNPKSGSMVKEERRIYVQINAAEPPKVTLTAERLDRVKKKALTTAEIELENLGFKLNAPKYVRGQFKNLVLDVQVQGRSVRSGETFTKGTALTLVVSDGTYDEEYENEEREMILNGDL